MSESVTGPLSFQTNVDVNGITNVLATQISVFCVWTTNETIVPSAIDGEDYLSTDSTNIVFDDFQMSQDIYLNLPSGNFSGFSDSQARRRDRNIRPCMAPMADVLLTLDQCRPGSVGGS